MPDIAMCNNSECPKAQYCWRFTAPKSVLQCYGDFDWKTCKCYWNNGKEMDMRSEKVEGIHEGHEGTTNHTNSTKELGFVCVSRNGVPQYRGAVCRAARLRDALNPDVSFGDMADIGLIFCELDFCRTYDFSPGAVAKMNGVAAPFHRFGVRDMNGVGYWGWWPEKVEGEEGTTNDANEDLCYGVEDQERLDADIEDAVNGVVDMCTEEEMPESLTVFEYRRAKADFGIDYMLDHVYEILDEEYGDPEGGQTDIPDVVKVKAEELKAVILANYKAWMCEPTGRKFEVDVKRYLDGDEHGAISESTEVAPLPEGEDV